MGQPPQRGHFTSKVSVSITVAFPNFGPRLDNDLKTRIGSCFVRRSAAVAKGEPDMPVARPTLETRRTCPR